MDFKDVAREEARTIIRLINPPSAPSAPGTWEETFGVVMADWARRYVSAQEPTDAEVLAVTMSIADVEDIDSLSPTEVRHYTTVALAALSAARNARQETR